jgi:hypothetical protein
VIGMGGLPDPVKPGGIIVRKELKKIPDKL